MNDDTTRDVDPRPLAILVRVDQICDRFEAAWPDPGQTAPRPRIEDYLGDTPEPERSQLLAQLLALELEYRRAAGENPSLDDYQSRFPDHSEVLRPHFVAPETVARQPAVHPSAPAPAAGALSSPARFRPLRFHDKGGLGEVHLAQDGELNRQVALKRIRDEYADDPDSRHRFLREAEITGGLEHPGIVPVYGLGQSADGRPFYAMRFIKGDSLKDAIARFHQAEGPKRDPGERTLALRALLGRFVAVCNAVGYAHSRGVLHRDLKPGNIMLGPYGETLVVDWGLAKAVGRPEDNKDSAEVTLRPTLASGAEPSQQGQVIGTLAYMAPEQAAGRLDELGPASDVYSLGATLYCLLTGRAPFENGEVRQMLPKVVRGEFPPPRQIKKNLPRPLAAICLKAMALKAEDRYASARAVADDVEHWLADEPVAAYREPWAMRAGRWVRRHKARVSSAGTAVLVAVLGTCAAIIWYQDEQNRRATEAALREAEEGRKLALAEQGVDEALKQGEETRRALHQLLRKPGGVFGLLNDPARWQALIQAARGSLQRAAALLANAGPKARGELARRLRRLEAELGRDDADRALALRLEKIRLDKAAIVEGKLTVAQAEREYPRAFRGAGLGQPGDAVPAVSARIRNSAIKEQLVATLDDWATIPGDWQRRTWLLAVARQADPDPWRDRFRDPKVWRDLAAQARLAREAPVGQLSPQLLTMLVKILGVTGGDVVPLWTAAQGRYPQDFWLNFELGTALQLRKQAGEAVGYYRAALALRPNASAVYNNLGIALEAKGALDRAIACWKKALALDPKHAGAHTNLGAALYVKGDRDGAIACYHKALAIDPKLAQAHHNLGLALKAQGDLDGAIACYEKALALDPKFAQAHTNLGNALDAKDDLDGAIACYHKALALDPKFAQAHYNLGIALQKKGEVDRAISCYHKALALDPKFATAHVNLGAILCDVKRDYDRAIACFQKALAIDPKLAQAHFNLGHALKARGEVDRAIACYQKALAINPKFAQAHGALGQALLGQGRFREARDSTRRSLQMLPERHPLRSMGSQQLHQCERLLVLDARLPALLQGQAQPASAAEGLEFAQLCRYKQLYAAAARFGAAAFTADPTRADQLATRQRYAAACCAARAAAGQGRDAPRDAPERARWRQQALAWLRADLALWAQILETGKPQARAAVQQQLRHWQRDADLAGIRDAAWLVSLPDKELQACRQLWADVAALLKRARGS
jgi:tetratricopeptide (TPR) repeat protein/tRNA A-37 threonylcarbamoyl transferase component Bud32